jgi:acyl carrier protein
MISKNISALTMQTSSTADEIQQIPYNKIQAWLVSYLSELLNLETDEVDVKLPFERYGLDSAAAASLVGDLESLLNTKLSPTLLYSYPTIETLAKHLAASYNLA